MPKITFSLDTLDIYLDNHHEKHDIKYFAMLNNAVALSDTQYEGGIPYETLNYYQYLLSLELPDCPIQFDLPVQQVKSMQTGITNLMALDKQLTIAYKNSSINTEFFLTGFIKSISQHCTEKGVCYLPSGWQGEKSSHFAGLKLRQTGTEGVYIISLINHGGGMQYHRVLSNSGDKEKRCYQSEEYRIDLNHDNGKELLAKLIQLRHDIQRKRDTEKVTNAYNEYDLYGLLELYGVKQKNLDKLTEKSATPQRTGTCTVTNVNAVARDILIDHDANLNIRKRHQFVIKLRSIIVAFYDYRKEQIQPQLLKSRQLLEWALRELEVRVIKQFKNVLTEDEVIYCGQLHAEIKQRLVQDKNEEIRIKCEKKPFPKMQGKILKLNQTFNEELEQDRIKLALQEIKMGIFEKNINEQFKTQIQDKNKGTPQKYEKSLNELTPTPLNIDKLLEHYLYKINPFSLDAMYDFLINLPACSGKDKDSFWDKVPPEHIAWIINKLSEITKKLYVTKGHSPERRSKTFAVAIIIYDISAQLATRYVKRWSADKITLKLGNEYALGLDDVYSKQCFFTDPVAYYKIKRVINNFEQRSKRKKRIFTNAVNYKGSKYDDSIHYVMRVFLDEEKRQIVTNALAKEKHQTSGSFSDKELFDYLMNNLYMNDTSQFLSTLLLDPTVAQLIRISATTHSLGHTSETYKKHKTLGIWYFNESQFLQEAARENAFEKTELSKHLPDRQANHQTKIGEHRDVSENTVYHPRVDLEKNFQNKYKKLTGWRGDEWQYSKEVSDQPYQIYLSGSTNPNSSIWEPKKDQLQLYEELNEDLRHIECSPNLQVMRTLSWCKHNLDKLKLGIVQKRINELIFQYGKIEQAFNNNPEALILLINAFLNEAFNYYQTEDLANAELLFWLSDLSYHLRCYIEKTAEIYQLPLEKFTGTSCSKILQEEIKTNQDADIKSKLASHFLRQYRITTPLTVENCCMLIIYRIIANLGNFDFISDGAWNNIQNVLLKTVKSNMLAIPEKLKELLASYFNLPKQEWRFENNRLISKDGKFIINLKNGYLQNSDGHDIKDCTDKTIRDNEALFLDLNLSAKNINLFYSDSSKTIQSSDGTWEFTYNVDNIYDEKKFIVEKIFQAINIQDTQFKFELLNMDKVDSFFNDDTNPFESKDRYTHYYQYWQSMEYQDIIFVRQKNSKIAYTYSRKDKATIRLSHIAIQQWQLSNHFLLNIANPQTTMEQNWHNRLKPIFGVENVRITITNNSTAYRIQTIEHLLLGLNFNINTKGQLMCNETQGFFLSTQQSLGSLLGLSSVLILENDKGDKKIIIPAFMLNCGEQNNALNFENIMNPVKLCNSSQPYYTYHLNSNNELTADSVEANLYLAIIYRSLGEFDKAMQYLKLSSSFKNLNKATLSIAMQILERKVTSPMGAAFDLKLAAYVNEHQQKWSNDPESRFEQIETADEWYKWINHQLDFYQKTLSAYKYDASILPQYCRLTESERFFLNFKKSNANLYNFLDNSNNQQNTVLNKRLKNICQLPLDIREGNINDWRRYIALVKGKYEHNYHSTYALAFDSRSLRIYEKSKTPALDHLITHFNSLFTDAISGNQTCLDMLHKKLFTLLQNDTDPSRDVFNLISLLQFVSKYPQLFTDFELPDSVFDTIIQVGEVFCRHHEEISDTKLYLYEDNCIISNVATEKSLPSDFQTKMIFFRFFAKKHQNNYKHPLGNMVNKYFSKQSKILAQRDFMLDEAGLSKDNLLEKRLFNQIKNGHHENQKKSKPIYEFNNNKTLNELRVELVNLKRQDTEKLLNLKERLIKALNTTPLDKPEAKDSETSLAYNLQCARGSEQLPALTLSNLFHAFLLQRPKLITKNNPFLSQKDIETLFSQLTEYALLQSRIDQVEQGLTSIAEKKDINEFEPYELQQFATLLDKSHDYNIKEYPEFLVYECATKRILRKDQIDTLIKLIKLIENKYSNESDTYHALLQFAAGGGKTAVLIPLLAQRFARNGFLPIIFNTNELYQIGLQDISKSLRESFNLNLEIIERELDHTWTITELKKLLQDLSRWRKEGKCLLMKPVTWHSLNLTMKLSYMNYNNRLLMAAGNVLDFFKYNCVKLEDEGHIVSDPLQQSIKTYGRSIPMPDEQLNLLSRFYDFLMDYEESFTTIAELAGIINNSKRPLTNQELCQIQQSLANAICAEPCFNKINYDELLNYLLKPECNRPQWLCDLHFSDEKTADLIILARAFIKSHLPYILSLQYRKDYGYSIHANDLTVAPKHEGKDVTSHHADHTLVAALTIQLYNQKGISSTQAKQLLHQLTSEHRKERQWNHNLSFPTQAEQLLFEYIPKQYSFHSYNDLTPKLIALLANDPKFFKSPKIIKKYLAEFALPQIRTPSYRQTSTAAELQAGFKHSLLLSATPGLPEIFPAFLPKENCFLEESFEASVIDTLLQNQNKGLCVLEKTQSPNDFFNQIPNELLAKMTTLIDRGALLTDFSPEEIIKTYLSLDKNQCSIKSSAFFSGKHLYFKTHETNLKDMQIGGTGLVEALKSQGIQPEKFLVFLFLDLSKTTGTDIKRPYRDHAGLTVGKSQTVTEIIQAAMRERQLLDDDAQSITWIMFQELYREIHPNTPTNQFDPRHIFYWMIKNEASQMEIKLINRAYQGIHQAIYELVWQKIRKEPDVYNPYLLQELLSLSPWKIYELESMQEDTKAVLHHYLDSLLEKLVEFNLSKETLPEHIKKRINTIITQTSELIPKMENPPKAQLNNEVQQEQQSHIQQEQQQQQQQRMKTKLDKSTDFVFATETYHPDTDNLSAVFSDNNLETKTYYQLLKLPNCKNLKIPKLLINKQHFAVMQASSGNNNSDIAELKPIKILLLQFTPNHPVRYLALTAAGAEYFNLLLNSQVKNRNESAYALMTTEGDVLHTTHNTDFINCQQFAQSEECQKMLTYTQFLNGQISNPNLLAKVIQEQQWSQNDYEQISQSISKVHVSQHPVALLNNETLKKLCRWGDNPITTSLLPNPRYQYVKSNSASTVQEQLCANSSENIPDSILLATKPKTALEGYIFGIEPNPLGINNNIILDKSIEQILSTTTNMDSDRKQAFLSLHKQIQTMSQALNPDFQSLPQLIKQYFDEYQRFDQLLVKIKSQLLCITNNETQKQQALGVITTTYRQFAAGQSVNDCCLYLKKHLEHIQTNLLNTKQGGLSFSTSPFNLFYKTPAMIIKNVLRDIDESEFLSAETSQKTHQNTLF